MIILTYACYSVWFCVGKYSRVEGRTGKPCKPSVGVKLYQLAHSYHTSSL